MCLYKFVTFQKEPVCERILFCDTRSVGLPVCSSGCKRKACKAILFQRSGCAFPSLKIVSIPAKFSTTFSSFLRSEFKFRRGHFLPFSLSGSMK